MHALAMPFVHNPCIPCFAPCLTPSEKLLLLLERYPCQHHAHSGGSHWRCTVPLLQRRTQHRGVNYPTATAAAPPQGCHSEGIPNGWPSVDGLSLQQSPQWHPRGATRLLFVAAQHKPLSVLCSITILPMDPCYAIWLCVNLHTIVMVLWKVTYWIPIRCCRSSHHCCTHTKNTHPG